MELQDLLVSCCKSFETAGLEFALAGGFAYGIHVEPRATVDIDFCVIAGTDKESVSRMLAEIFDSHVPHKKAMIAGKVAVWRFVGVRDGSEFIIDLIEPRDAEYAENIITRKIHIEFEGCAIPVISIEDLYILKKNSSRLRDAADCATIEEIFPALMNDQYVKSWMRRLAEENS
jgi:hypothetical protein